MDNTTPTTGCGCRLDPVSDDNDLCDLCSEATGMFDGVGWTIVFCPLHAAAPELLEALTQARDGLLEWMGDHNDAIDETDDNLLAVVDAAIDKAIQKEG